MVVAFGEAERSLRCIASLMATEWSVPIDIIVVDNGGDGTLQELLATRFPTVRYERSRTNVGYGAAAQRGFDSMRGCDFLALLNNDIVVEPSWLRPLVDTLLSTGAGAAAPTVLLCERYTSVRLRCGGRRPAKSDRRVLGVQVSGVRVDGFDVTDHIEAVSGLWGWELDPETIGGSYSWTGPEAVLEVPGAADGAALELRLSCPLWRSQVGRGGGRRARDDHRRPRPRLASRRKHPVSNVD